MELKHNGTDLEATSEHERFILSEQIENATRSDVQNDNTTNHPTWQYIKTTIDDECSCQLGIVACSVEN